MDVVTLKELVEGEAVFESNGVSMLKVTKDGQEETVVVPIRSIPLRILEEDPSSRPPQPPVKRILIKADSPEGQDAGLHKDTFADVLDYADEAYQEAWRKHSTEMLWDTALKGIALEFRDKDGNKVTDRKKKVEILKRSGLSAMHLEQIARDVRALNAWSEERADFLSEEPSG